MMLKFYYSCALFLFTFFEVSSNLIYRSDYETTANGWYKVHLPADWREARLRCHLEGAVLASPLDIELLFRFQNLYQYYQKHIYTGIHATFSRGDYYSIEGVPLSSIPVIMESRNNKECVIFSQNNKVVDVDCNEMYTYMCYKKNDTKLSVTECGTTDTQYTLDSRTGSCYKFHSTPNTWSRAFMTCAAEGGHLAIINSETEAQVIRELYAKYPDDDIFGKNNKYVAHIGHHDWGEHGQWLTIHGQTLKQAGYEKWERGQPDNATTGEFCGSVFRSGLLDDVWCHERFPFICEKNTSTLRPEAGWIKK